MKLSIPFGYWSWKGIEGVQGNGHSFEENKACVVFGYCRLEKWM